MSLARYYLNERARKGDLGKPEKGDKVGWDLNRVREVGTGHPKAQKRAQSFTLSYIKNFT